MNLVDSETVGSDKELRRGPNHLLVLISGNVPQARRIIPLTFDPATFSSANLWIALNRNFIDTKKPSIHTRIRQTGGTPTCSARHFSDLFLFARRWLTGVRAPSVPTANRFPAADSATDHAAGPDGPARIPAVRVASDNRPNARASECHRRDNSRLAAEIVRPVSGGWPPPDSDATPALPTGFHGAGFENRLRIPPARSG